MTDSVRTITVLGLDLSLTSTGVAYVRGGLYETRRIKPANGLTGHDRLYMILGQIGDLAIGVDLVAVEGPSYGNQGSGRQAGHHERAGLWWLVTHELWCRDRRIAVVPPAALKRYATGKGNAGKDDVLREVVRRFPAFEGGNDEADALVLAAMGADQLGTPVVTMPATYRAALSSVEWPADLAPKGDMA